MHARTRFHHYKIQIKTRIAPYFFEKLLQISLAFNVVLLVYIHMSLQHILIYDLVRDKQQNK